MTTNHFASRHDAEVEMAEGGKNGDAWVKTNGAPEELSLSPAMVVVFLAVVAAYALARIPRHVTVKMEDDIILS